jgi:hypothetical protein
MSGICDSVCILSHSTESELQADGLEPEDCSPEGARNPTSGLWQVPFHSDRLGLIKALEHTRRPMTKNAGVTGEHAWTCAGADQTTNHMISQWVTPP